MSNVSSFKVEEFINNLFSYYYPNFYDNKVNKDTLLSLLSNYIDKDNLDIISSSIDQLKIIADDDLDFYFQKDPAMISKEEIVISNLAYRCIQMYRVAHLLKDYNPLISSLISSYAKRLSGIDISYLAKIDHPFFIDHGVGTVIGATSIVGKRVSLYQCVTLGARSLKDGRKLCNIKRHPTLEDDVTMYSYSAIFGNITIEKGRVIKAYEKIVA